MKQSCNEENVNGTHPAMMALLQTNTDVQLPYRFAIVEETHDNEQCRAPCVERSQLDHIEDLVQSSQDAQVGYTCDYQNKRAARSCNEVKERMKGHKKLMKDIAERGPSYIGRRQVQRLMSDAYGKGIVRSNQESTNLRIGGRDDRVTSAESFSYYTF